MKGRKRIPQDWKPDPGVLDLFTFAEEAKKLAVKAEGIVNDLRDFGFDAGVACVDHPDALGVRVRVAVFGFWGSLKQQWEIPRKAIPYSRFEDLECIAEQIEVVHDHLVKEYGVCPNLWTGGSLILSTPPISRGGKVEKKR